MKNIAKGPVSLNLLAFLITAAAAWLLGRSSASDLLDTASYVGVGMGAFGALMFVGSGSGISGSTGMAASAADQPSRLMSALWMDRSAGISTGALLVPGASLGSPSHGCWRRSPDILRLRSWLKASVERGFPLLPARFLAQRTFE